MSVADFITVLGTASPMLQVVVAFVLGMEMVRFAVDLVTGR